MDISPEAAAVTMVVNVADDVILSFWPIIKALCKVRNITLGQLRKYVLSSVLRL